MYFLLLNVNQCIIIFRTKKKNSRENKNYAKICFFLFFRKSLPLQEIDVKYFDIYFLKSFFSFSLLFHSFSPSCLLHCFIYDIYKFISIYLQKIFFYFYSQMLFFTTTEIHFLKTYINRNLKVSFQFFSFHFFLKIYIRSTDEIKEKKKKEIIRNRKHTFISIS